MATSTKDIGARETVFAGKDIVVIRNVVTDVKGGVVLDVTDYEPAVIYAGSLVIKSGDSWKPMPVSDGAYSTLTDGYEYAGVVITTTPTSEPLVPVMIAGDVNDNCLPYAIDDIEDAVKEALPNITWSHDVY